MLRQAWYPLDEVVSKSEPRGGTGRMDFASVRFRPLILLVQTCDGMHWFGASRAGMRRHSRKVASFEALRSLRRVCRVVLRFGVVILGV